MRGKDPSTARARIFVAALIGMDCVVYMGTERGRGGRWVPRWRLIVPERMLEA